MKQLKLQIYDLRNTTQSYRGNAGILVDQCIHMILFTLRKKFKIVWNYVLGNCMAGAPFLWKIPSTNTPFLPLHVMKKCGGSKRISTCFLEMKLECPIFTSTEPLELFRPTIIFFCRTRYSNSRPSNLAIAVPSVSGHHWIFEGLVGADLRASKAQASFSWAREWVVIFGNYFPGEYADWRLINWWI